MLPRDSGAFGRKFSDNDLMFGSSSKGRGGLTVEGSTSADIAKRNTLNSAQHDDD